MFEFLSYFIILESLKLSSARGTTLPPFAALRTSSEASSSRSRESCSGCSLCLCSFSCLNSLKDLFSSYSFLDTALRTSCTPSLSSTSNPISTLISTLFHFWSFSNRKSIWDFPQPSSDSGHPLST